MNCKHGPIKYYPNKLPGTAATAFNPISSEWQLHLMSCNSISLMDFAHVLRAGT